MNNLNLPQAEKADTHKPDQHYLKAWSNDLSAEETNTLLFMLLDAMHLTVTRENGQLVLSKEMDE